MLVNCVYKFQWKLTVIFLFGKRCWYDPYFRNIAGFCKLYNILQKFFSNSLFSLVWLNQEPSNSKNIFFLGSLYQIVFDSSNYFCFSKIFVPFCIAAILIIYK